MSWLILFYRMCMINLLLFDDVCTFFFQRLGSPTLAVTNESFVPMLSRLDDCILYITNNVSDRVNRKVYDYDLHVFSIKIIK